MNFNSKIDISDIHIDGWIDKWMDVKERKKGRKEGRKERRERNDRALRLVLSLLPK